MTPRPPVSGEPPYDDGERLLPSEGMEPPVSGEPKAALITINFDTEEVLHTIYRGKNGYSDPIKNCENMRASVGDDFPDHEHHIIGNEAAMEAAGKRRMKDWFGIEADRD